MSPVRVGPRSGNAPKNTIREHRRRGESRHLVAPNTLSAPKSLEDDGLVERVFIASGQYASNTC